jgi:ornithine cyclodeaminase/alanine dehydrogenase-like protein (mu-crystallin family)
MESGYRADARGEVVPVPRTRTDARGVTLAWMGAALPNLDLLGYRSYLYNSAGMDRGEQVVALYRYSTMELKALFLGRRVGIQRTGAALVAALRIAQPNLHAFGLLGTGTQAREALACAVSALQLDTVWVWSPSASHRAEFKAWAALEVHQNVNVGENAHQVIRESQAIAIVTSSETPVVTSDMLPGPRLLLSISAYRRPEIDLLLIDGTPTVWTDSVDQASAKGSLFADSPRREKLRPLLRESDVESLRDPGSTRIIINTGAAWEEVLVAESLLRSAERLNVGLRVDFASDRSGPQSA